MKTTLVFGASLKPNRYSNIVINRLVSKGINTEAFGLRSGVIGGVQVKTNLDEFQNIHTITLYLNPTRQVQYYQAIIMLQPERVIFNPGTENKEFIGLLEAQGIEAEVACTLVLLATDQY
ncbi:CoA-binding protein [Maribacter cobaltidurans]|uniref:CoA-binding protein n=1 Tax=Maribacter cobaltidurans TaxID=1178778 RepID=A0A223V7G6_9FLAO|nr:CoA-binding protein [Maribacter cobaltidurans]ASV31341.1 CoA-binding protein [Maribacter cobaltidurans]GGD83071.1 CoA-binding protein [Maribacter cobaltidurans]